MTQENSPVLHLIDASLTLNSNTGPVEILHAISLDVQQGETLGLVGPSGSGKSSLLMLMGGLEQATGGRVSALGADLTAMDEDALARFRRNNMPFPAAGFVETRGDGFRYVPVSYQLMG